MRKNVGTFGEKKPVWHRERDFLAPLKIRAAVNKSCKTNPHNMYICIPGLCDNTITDCDIDFDVLLSQHLPIGGIDMAKSWLQILILVLQKENSCYQFWFDIAKAPEKVLLLVLWRVGFNQFYLFQTKILDLYRKIRFCYHVRYIRTYRT